MQYLLTLSLILMFLTLDAQAGAQLNVWRCSDNVQEATYGATELSACVKAHALTCDPSSPINYLYLSDDIPTLSCSGCAASFPHNKGLCALNNAGFGAGANSYPIGGCPSATDGRIEYDQIVTLEPVSVLLGIPLL